MLSTKRPLSPTDALQHTTEEPAPKRQRTQLPSAAGFNRALSAANAGPEGEDRESLPRLTHCNTNLQSALLDSPQRTAGSQALRVAQCHQSANNFHGSGLTAGTRRIDISSLLNPSDAPNTASSPQRRYGAPELMVPNAATSVSEALAVSSRIAPIKNRTTFVQLPTPAARAVGTPETDQKKSLSDDSKPSALYSTYIVDADESSRPIIPRAQAAPEVPIEIALLVLDEARPNPLQLMELMASKNSVGKASVWSDVAHSNAYWAPFVPQAQNPTDLQQASYATAFVERYRAMSQAHRDILQVLWWGPQSFSKCRVHKNLPPTPWDDFAVVQTLSGSPCAWNNFDIVRALVGQDGNLLAHADSQLRRDRDIVRAAVSRDGGVLEYAHEDLQRDRDIVLVAVSQDGEALEYAHEDLQRDRDIVLVAVSQKGWMLEWAHPDLQRDKGIVLAAVSQSGGALEYAHEDLQRDRDVVEAAVSRDGVALEYAHGDLQRDRVIVLAAVSREGGALGYVHDDLQRDEDIVLAAVSQSGWVLELVVPQLQRNRSIVRAAVSQDGVSLKYAHADLQCDQDIVRTAVNQCGLALAYAHTLMQRDPQIVRTAIRQNGLALAYAHEDLQRDPNIVRAAVSQDGVALRYAHPDLQRDQDIVRTAVNQDGWAIEFAHADLRRDCNIVRAAVSRESGALRYAHPELQRDPQMRALAGWGPLGRG